MTGHATALLGTHGLARLPGELVDLICSFVLTFEVNDTITTLCSLALTSRHFLEPARRALLHDPSRILATRSEYEAHLLLNRIIRRPALGIHIKCLDGLVDVYDTIPELTSFYECPLAFLNWAFALLRCCKNVVSVAVWPSLEAGWLEELDNLRRLRRLVVQVRRADDDNYWAESAALVPFLAEVELERLHSLALRHCSSGTHTGAIVHLPELRLELINCSIAPKPYDLGICLDHVRHLSLRPSRFEDLESLAVTLPANLETLVLELFEGHKPVIPSQFRHSLSWLPLFKDSPQLRNLRTAILDSVQVHIAAFEELCAAAPNLEHIELRNSSWDPIGQGLSLFLMGPYDARLVDALSRLPHLRFLHLGQIAGDADNILDTRMYCQLFHIELEWRVEGGVGVQLEGRV